MITTNFIFFPIKSTYHNTNEKIKHEKCSKYDKKNEEWNPLDIVIFNWLVVNFVGIDTCKHNFSPIRSGGHLKACSHPLKYIIERETFIDPQSSIV